MSLELRRLVATLVVVLVAVFALDTFLTMRQSASPVPLAGTRLAASEPGYTYHEFATGLSASANGFADVVTGSGSVDNIDKVISGEAEFGLAQNDTLLYAFEGMKGMTERPTLRAVLPVFSESVRLYAPKAQGLQTLRGLQGGSVCVGAIGSGSYFNAVAVMQALGFTAGVDFNPVYSNARDCLDSIQSGEDIRALFLTSHKPLQTQGTVSEVALPSSVINGLLETHRVFSLGTDTDGRPRLKVDTYIVTDASTENAQVYAMARTVRAQWPRLRETMPSLPERPMIASRSTIPLHVGARSVAMSRTGGQRSSFFNPLVMFGWLSLLLLCLWAERQKTSYNRLGDTVVDAWAERVIVNLFGRFSRILLGVSAILVFVAFSVMLLRFAESLFSRTTGQPSAFLDLDFGSSLMWLFSYISSGFTTDGVYPISMLGQLIAALLAVVGVLGPFTAIIFIVNAASRRAQRSLTGLGRSQQRRHVLLCGWNEKAPGIIYTLTGNDVDERKKVTIIADMELRNPFEAYKFDANYVSFVRGNSADIETLERANAAEASAAIILADFAGLDDRNADSILTVMNLRRLRPGLHICAELEYEENRDLFRACGCDVVIDAHSLTSRLAASAVLSPEIIDYVLDTVSYHEHDELYSTQARDMPNLSPFIGRPIREAELAFLSAGVNIVGLLKENVSLNTMTREEFGELSALTALVDSHDSQEILTEDCVLIYASKTRARIRKVDAQQTGALADPISPREFRLAIDDDRRILACGDASALDDLRRNLCYAGDAVKLDTIDTSRHELKTFSDVKSHIKPDSEYDTIVILVSEEERAAFRNETEMNAIDSRSILLTRLMQSVFEAQRQQPVLISEIMNIRNKELFIGAGAETVLPASLSVERFLTKEVYDNACVLQYVMALLNRCDGVYLHSHTVTPGDGFYGESYRSALATEIEGLRIVGWLPMAMREKLRNSQNDFDYHFRTVIDGRNESEIIREGDVLVMIIRPRSSYFCGADDTHIAVAAE